MTSLAIIDWWQVTERASWVVGLGAFLFGLPFTIYQLIILRREEKRIADDLARRPKLEVGFLPGRRKTKGEAVIPVKTLEVNPTWLPGQESSEPVAINIACHNNGTRSARDVLYNIEVQAGFEMVATKPSQEENVVVNPLTGLHMWIYKDEVIHPGDTASFGTTITVMKGRDKVSYDVEVSYDYGKIAAELTIFISPYQGH